MDYLNIIGNVNLETIIFITFGSNVTLYPNVHIFGLGRIILEDNVDTGDGTIICASKDIIIEKNSMIAAQCYIIDCNHGIHLFLVMNKQPMSVHPVKIVEDALIGCDCKVLAGSEITNGTVMGVNTVLNGKIEEKVICYTKREYCKKAEYNDV